MTYLGPRIDALRKQNPECIEVVDELVRLVGHARMGVADAALAVAESGLEEAEKERIVEAANMIVYETTLYP